MRERTWRNIIREKWDEIHEFQQTWIESFAIAVMFLIFFFIIPTSYFITFVIGCFVSILWRFYKKHKSLK